MWQQYPSETNRSNSAVFTCPRDRPISWSHSKFPECFRLPVSGYKYTDLDHCVCGHIRKKTTRTSSLKLNSMLCLIFLRWHTPFCKRLGQQLKSVELLFFLIDFSNNSYKKGVFLIRTATFWEGAHLEGCQSRDPTHTSPSPKKYPEKSLNVFFF
jgi:hypothetical protein